MVCNSAGSECTTQVDKDVTLKQALEELLKCMLRVWCREGQALARFGATTTGNGMELDFYRRKKMFRKKRSKDRSIMMNDI